MISYNKIELDNLRIHADLKKKLKWGFITDAEFKTIAEKYPVYFYTPGIFARIGLFILSFIVVGFAEGLISLVPGGEIVITFGWLLFLGVLSYVALEFIINHKYYRSGVDDALLIIAGGQFVAAFARVLDSQGSFYLPFAVLVFILYAFLTLRFSDMLASAVCCIAFFAVVYFGCDKIGSLGLTVVPFIMMLASGAVYWLIYTYGDRKQFINYKNCIIVVKTICLLTLYGAGNYFIVQTLSNELTGQAKPIAFGWFFWIWTILLPFAYIAFGIRKKDVILLRIGLVLIGAAAITFRTYYHLIPTDVALTIAGALILGVVYVVMQYLKIPKHGFTTAEPDEALLMDNIRIESLLVAKTFSHAPAAPANDGVKFGGGDFGGGGSSSNF